MRFVFAFFMLWAAVASAQPFPAKPLKLVTPFPPGGSADVIARLQMSYSPGGGREAERRQHPPRGTRQPRLHAYLSQVRHPTRNSARRPVAFQAKPDEQRPQSFEGTRIQKYHHRACAGQAHGGEQGDLPQSGDGRD